MTIFYRLALAFVAGLTLVSCFKDEPLNAECDIEEAYIHADVPEEMFFQKSDTLVRVQSAQSVISFLVRRGTDLTALAPQFRLTPGATISPASGSVHDFTAAEGVTYTVTSQDGSWHRDYTVRVTLPKEEVEFVDYDFEHFFLETAKQKYYVWSDLTAEREEKLNWATGNGGYAIAKSSAKPDEYPTTPYEHGVDGYAVKLETRSTGAFGEMMNMRIAAGNLFTGTFDVKSATKAPLMATHFGEGINNKLNRRPLRISGYYQYAPGAEFKDREGNVVAGRVDQGDLYAVVFKNTDDTGQDFYLTGDNVRTSPQIVALAQVGPVGATEGGWQYFETDFSYSADIDPALLDSYGYSLAVVFTSSVEGASFQGAVGSTLLVDKVRIVVEK